MNSVNQGPCWDTGDIHGRGKAQGKAETSPPWTPSPWKSSLCHDRLKEQAGCHLHVAAACPLPARLPTTTGGLQHHQTPAPNLPRRCRQTALDAKGVTPELLKLKFYCSWARDFFSFSFFFSLSVCLSCSLFDCPPSLPVDFFGSPFFFLFLFFFFSFFLGFVSFTIVS
jgi:hypothetical protein